MKSGLLRVITLFSLLFAIHATGADFWERIGLGKKKSSTTEGVTSAAVASLSQDQVINGIKEALAKGMRQAVTNLGKVDGFLKDSSVAIPMPESLGKVEKVLRSLHQDKLADEFIGTMNHAAEQAVPAAAAVLGDAITQMSLADAKTILTSTNSAATEYFRRVSGASLREKFLPIVKDATAKTGVTSAYKQMLEKTGALRSFIQLDSLDLDNYVTEKALDGLFVKIADEEKRIRENPVARTTELLQKVFGSIKP